MGRFQFSVGEAMTLQFIETAKAMQAPGYIPPLVHIENNLSPDAMEHIKSALLAKVESSPGVVSASDLGIKSIELKEGEFPKIEFEGTIMETDPDGNPWTAASVEDATMLVGVDTAIGNDMTTLAVCKAVPPGGEPGQLLAISEDGEPEWITLDFGLLSPSPTPDISLKQALQVLEDYGFKFEQVSVQNDYHHYNSIGSLSPPTGVLGAQTIEVQMLVYPPSSKYDEVMTVLHDAAMNKGFKY